MYNAPAVVFPVGRSCVEASVLALFWSFGTAGVAYWLAVFNHPAWVIAVAAAVLFATGLASVFQWCKRWVGALRWDRQKWTFCASPSGASVAQDLSGIAVLLDLQSVLLVRFKVAGGRHVTFWLDRSAARAHWRALRRALYARPRDRDKKAVAQISGHKDQVA